MQNWSDSSLLKLPGFRDRFATVHLEADEGGMNLEMDAGVIAELAEYGGRAGEALRERFEKTDGEGPELNWTNHRWTRLRSTLDSLQDWLDKLVAGLDAEEAPSFEELVGRGRDDPPTSYRLRAGQRELVLEVLERLRALHAQTDGHRFGLRPGAPRPRPELRSAPRTSYPSGG